MDKKDYKTLMEAYDEIASLTISPDDHDESESDFSRESDLEVHQADSSEHEDLEGLEDEKINMVETRLRSLIAHTHQAIDAIKKGSVIEPWMQDLVTIAENNIVKTANALVYKH
jgi:hypothetical protein